MSESKKNEFVELAGQKRTNILREFLDFLQHNKKWWLLPILLILLLLGVIVLLSSSAIAPFLYPIF